MDEICKSLKNNISVTSGDSNHLDRSFVYTQLFQQMFVQIQHDNQIKTDFIHFSREQD
jgi:hypothetical protein